MVEHKGERLDIREGVVKARPVSSPKLDTVSCDMGIGGTVVKPGNGSLPKVSPYVTRSFSYLVGRSKDGFVLLRCTPEGNLIVEQTGKQQSRFGDSIVIDDVIKPDGWKVHTLDDIYNYLYLYVFGTCLEVETSMDGSTWGNRRLTIGNAFSAPHVSTLELCADFRHIRIRLTRGSKPASYSINASKVE